MEVDQESGLAFLALIGQIPPPNGLNLPLVRLFLHLRQ